MEKNLKTKQQLSEEQLQTIAGGCEQCDAVRTRLKDAKSQMNYHAQQYNAAIAQGNQSQAKQHYTQNMSYMEKNLKTKQQLSEEQLQTIAGGCEQCDAVRTRLKDAKSQMNYHAQQYNAAIAQGNQSQAKQHYTQNMSYIDRVAALQSELASTKLRLHRV